MRVAFQILSDGRWLAGEVYLNNLFYALARNPEKELELCLIPANGQMIKEEYARSLGVDRILAHHVPQKWTPSWLLNGAHKRFRLTDQFGGKNLARSGVDVFFGSTVLFKYPGIGTLSWLPDFQHVHLPEMFTDEERRDRDEEFRQSALAATRVILPCNAARDDFEAFLPKFVYKVRVTHPLSYIPEAIYQIDPRHLLELYHLPEKFIYLPNQFWRHKNHQAIFETLKILKNRGIKITVVCSGYPGDYRDAAYFANLWEKVSHWNVRDQIIYLGMIPRQHVLLLMRQCVSVLNPSLFEGWGMSVDEARSLGKQVIVSDIAAHREQNPPKAIFFDPKNRDELAEKLREVWQVSKPGPDFELEAEARVSLPSRLAAFAGTFLAYCREVYEEVHS